MKAVPEFLFDANGPDGTPCELDTVGSICRSANNPTAAAALAACGLHNLVEAIQGVSHAAAAFSEQEWLAEGGKPAMPFSPSLPPLQALRGAIGDLQAAIIAARGAADPAPPLLFHMVSLVRRLDQSGAMEWGPLAVADELALIGVIGQLLHADREGRPPRAIRASVRPSVAMDIALARLADVLQPLMGLVDLATLQAARRDHATARVLNGTAWVEEGSVIATRPAEAADYKAETDAADADAAFELELVVVRLESFPSSAKAAVVQIEATRRAAAQAIGHGRALHRACFAAPSELVSYRMAAGCGAGYPDAALGSRIEAALAACGPAIDLLGQCLAAAS